MKSKTAAPPDPFRLGWRFVRKPSANGKYESEMVPLTAEDVLHPQENDQIPENTIQENDRRYLASVLEYQMADRPHLVVLSDCLVNWGDKGLRNHSPDISVFDGVADPRRSRSTFYMAREGSWPLLVIEIVSVDEYDADIRNNDVVKKVDHYYRAGVPLYVIIDMEVWDGPRKLIGYRRGSRRYVRFPADAQGRLLLEPVNLLLGLRDNKAVCFDAATGEEIGGLTAQAHARKAAEAALAAAQERIRELEAQARPHRSRRRPPRSGNG